MSDQAARMRQEGTARIAEGEAMLKRGRALKSAITAFHHRIKRTVPARARLRRTRARLAGLYYEQEPKA